MKWITRPEFSKFGHKLHTRYVLSKLKGVEDLQPVDTDAGRQDVAIGFLTCSRHLSLMMLAAKSFYHFAGIVCPLYVWDDGSLTPSDRQSLLRLFPTARLLRRSELRFDLLAPYPLLSSFARLELEHYRSYAPSLKLLGPLASPGVPSRFILSDSDAFFFDWPQAIHDWLDEDVPTNRHLAPWSGQDNVQEGDLRGLYARLGIVSPPRVNSGLLLFHRSLFELDAMEQILAWYQKHGYAWDIEQTIYRLLMARSGNAVALDQDDYVLCHRKYNAVCHHFFTSVIFDELVVRRKIVNLMEYIADCEKRRKPPVSVAQQAGSSGLQVS